MYNIVVVFVFTRFIFVFNCLLFCFWRGKKNIQLDRVRNTTNRKWLGRFTFIMIEWIKTTCEKKNVRSREKSLENWIMKTDITGISQSSTIEDKSRDQYALIHFLHTLGHVSFGSLNFKFKINFDFKPHKSIIRQECESLCSSLYWQIATPNYIARIIVYMSNNYCTTSGNI